MSAKHFKRGMILCAGLGTRLNPITSSLPKPLVPILNIANVVHTLRLLAREGVVEIILNTYHLSQELENFIADGSKFGVQMHYSHEPELLGTGGGIKKAENFLSQGPFIVANCDFISNVPLSTFMSLHTSSNAYSTMVLCEDQKRQSQYAPVGVDKNENLCSLPKYEREKPYRTGIFTGIHLLDPIALTFLPKGRSGVNEVLYPRLLQEFPDRAFGRFLSKKDYWYDTGEIKSVFLSTIELLKKLLEKDPFLMAVLRENGFQELKSGVWGLDSSLPKGVEFKPPVVLGANVQCKIGAQIGPFTVLPDGCEVTTKGPACNYVGMGSPLILSATPEEPMLQYLSFEFAQKAV